MLSTISSDLDDRCTHYVVADIEVQPNVDHELVHDPNGMDARRIDLTVDRIHGNHESKRHQDLGALFLPHGVGLEALNEGEKRLEVARWLLVARHRQRCSKA